MTGFRSQPVRCTRAISSLSLSLSIRVILCRPLRTDLTGITDYYVRNAKLLEQVLKEFQEFCQTVSKAHNATLMGMMNVNYERHNLPKITQPVIDTLDLPATLSRVQAPWSGALTKRFQIALEHHHMANYDA